MGKKPTHKFSTKAIHTPYVRKDSTGALNMPIYENVAYEFESSEQIEAAFKGKINTPSYSRTSNPTVEYLEHTIKNITGSLAVLSLSSGMAAISNILITLTASGDNIITTPYLFGNTFSLFTNTMKHYGLETRLVDFNNLNEVEKNIDEKTRFVFLETITNPQLEVVNILNISKICKKHNIPLIVDSTTTPLYLFNAKDFGVDIEVISSTKFISGGGTALGGLVIDYGTFDWGNNPKLYNLAKEIESMAFMAKLRREVFRNFGSCLSPHAAYFHSLGLETLALRAKQACDNCLTIAKHLQLLKQVKSVNYPGLESSNYFKISKKQFKYPGAILTFELDSQEACYKFMDNLKIIRRATNLNDNKSLIIHPASTIFSEFSEETLNKLNVKTNSIRLSIGIEDVEDLINDINQAFKN